MTACSAPSWNRPRRPGSDCGRGKIPHRRGGIPPGGADRAPARRRAGRLVVRSARPDRRGGAGAGPDCCAPARWSITSTGSDCRKAATPLPGSSGPAPPFRKSGWRLRGSADASPSLERLLDRLGFFLEPGRHHRAARRRRRDRQRRRRIYREQDRGDRDAEMPRRRDRPRLRRLSAADPGAGADRHRDRPDAGRRRAAGRGTAARGTAAGLAAGRGVLGAARLRGAVRLAGDAGLYAVAARRDRPHPARRAVARPGAPAPRRLAPLAAARDRARRAGAGRGDRAERAGAAASRCGISAARSPPLRCSASPRGPIAAAARRAPRPSRPLLRLALANLHRPGGAAGAGRRLARHRSQRDDRGRAGAGQSGGRDRRASGRQRPGRFLYRHPARPARRVRARSSPRSPAPGSSRCRCSGAASRGSNGTPVEQAAVAPEAQWALRNERGLTYAALPPKGSRLVAGEWWPPDYRGPPLISFDAELAQRHGAQDRRHADRQPARPRDHRAHRQSAADRMEPARHQFRHCLRAGHARSGAADPPRRRLRAPPKTRSASPPQVTERFPNVTAIPVREALAAVAGIVETDRQRGPRHRLGDAGRRGARARRRDCRRASPARLRLGAAEGARRDAGLYRRHVSGRAPAARGWSRRRSRPASARLPPGRSSPGR